MKSRLCYFPELLDHLAETKQLKGALVTIDAMGCQVAIADKIVEHEADYMLALKGSSQHSKLRLQTTSVPRRQKKSSFQYPVDGGPADAKRLDIAVSKRHGATAPNRQNRSLAPGKPDTGPRTVANQELWSFVLTIRRRVDCGPRTCPFFGR